MQEITKTPKVISVLEKTCYNPKFLRGTNVSKFSDPIECLLDNITSEMIKWINTNDPEPIIEAYRTALEANIDWKKVKYKQRVSWEMITESLPENFNIEIPKLITV